MKSEPDAEEEEEEEEVCGSCCAVTFVYSKPHHSRAAKSLNPRRMSNRRYNSAQCSFPSRSPIPLLKWDYA